MSKMIIALTNHKMKKSNRFRKGIALDQVVQNEYYQNSKVIL